MKKLFLLPILLLSLISCSKETTDSLVERDGLSYKEFSEKPFTGVYKKYHENGQLLAKFRYENGKPLGKFVAYHENGSLAQKGVFNKEGKPVELSTYWDHGGLEAQISSSNGVAQHTWFYYNGQLQRKGSYKNDKREGEWSYYNADGTINEDKTGTYKSGKKISD